MYNQLSTASLKKLENVHPDLVKLVKEVSIEFPLMVVDGHRNEAEQNEAYKLGRSKKKFPESKHNELPSQAVDLAPLPYAPKDVNKLIYFSGFVVGMASKMGIKIRWGGDWDMDRELSDETFRDLFHFELTV